MPQIVGKGAPAQQEVDLDKLPPHPRNVEADEDEFELCHVVDRPGSLTQLRARIELDYADGEPTVVAHVRQFVEKGLWNDRRLQATYRFTGYSGRNGPQFKMDLEQLKELYTNVGVILEQIEQATTPQE